MEDHIYAAYKNMLLELSDCIEDIHLTALKFRCDKIIKKAESQKISTPVAVFSALEQRELLAPRNLTFLKELLSTCMGGKVDGLRVVERYEEQFCHEEAAVQNKIFSRANLVTGPPQVVYVQNAYQPPLQLDCHQTTGRPSPGNPKYVGPDLSNEITFLSRSLGRDWRFYVRAIGVDEADIENVECDYRSVRERIHQCLLAWQLQEQQFASRQKLVEGLRDISVQRNDLASSLEEGNFT